MKLGLLSAILADSTFEQVVDHASSVGYNAVELACWPFGKAARRYAGVTHIDITQLDETKISYIQQYCANKKIEIAALGYYPNPLDPNLESRQIVIDHLMAVIKASAQIGVFKVITFIGKDKNKTIDENLAIFESIWKPIIDFAEQEKVWVGIENCPMFFSNDEWPGGLNLASSPYIWRKLFDIINSDYFGLAYDPSHLYLQGMDYIKPLFDFKDKIKHVHIKDIEVYSDKINEHGIFTAPLNYMSPKIPGHGGINWGKFISALNDIEYKASACVEIEDRSFESSTEDIANAIAISFRYINQFI